MPANTLHGWFETPLGQYLLEKEQAYLDGVTPDMFGFHALQVGLTKRMSNRWQASATYSVGAQWNFDQLPLNPGCEHPVTYAAATGFTCDVPITLAEDIAENDWYLGNEQRHRVTFNGIWDAAYGF